MAVGRFRHMLTEVRHIDDAPSRIRQWNHNTAQFRSSARQAETRYENLLPQGPGLPSSAGFLSPPAPRSSGQIGPNPFQQTTAARLFEFGERGAEQRARLLDRAALHQHRGAVDA